MSIEDPEKFAAGHWDWAILNGCFGDSKIKPTDIDGAIERNGFFLFLEAKAPGAQLKMGQRIFYEQLTRVKHISAIVVWGQTNRPAQYQMHNWIGTSKILPCTPEKFRAIVAKWYERANQRQPVTLLEAYILKRRVS